MDLPAPSDKKADCPDRNATRSVLFLNRVHPPADGATGHLLAELARELTQLGWEVTVVTGRTKGHAARSERIEGVRIERVGGLPFTRSSHWRRAVSYGTLYPALLGRALRLPRADVVVTLTDPPLLAVLGPVLKWIKGSRLVHWAQDVYPELAEELGILRRNGWLAGLCRRLSVAALRRHDGIIAVGGCMQERLRARGLPAAAIRVVPNWATGPADGRDLAAENPFRRQQGLEGRFVVMYSGNFGLAHQFDSILDAARRIEATRPKVLFLLVGDGPRLSAVKEQVRAAGIGNIRFLSPQPSENLAHSLSAAQIHLVSMRENLCGLVVPSKIYGVLTVGRPCIFLGPRGSEAARVIEEHGCGSVLSAADGETLARCLEKWFLDPAGLRAAGDRARSAAGIFGRARAVHAFDEVLRQVLAREQATVSVPEELPASTQISAARR